MNDPDGSLMIRLPSRHFPITLTIFSWMSNNGSWSIKIQYMYITGRQRGYQRMSMKKEVCVADLDVMCQRTAGSN